jgi:hypothetical protein
MGARPREPPVAPLLAALQQTLDAFVAAAERVG